MVSTLSTRWRWAAPLGAVAVIAAGSIGASVAAQADPGLPPRTAEQLVTDVLTAHVDGFSGTVQSTASLGLPDLSVLGGKSDQTDFVTSLLTGSHSYRVWAAGDDKARVSIPDGADETDLITNGRTHWVWSSADQTATRYTEPEQKASRTPSKQQTSKQQTPQQLAQGLLKQVGTYSTVSTSSASTVAGHSAYELVVTPKQAGTKIAKIEIAVDGTTHVPLRLQVFAKGAAKASLELGFTSVSFAVPAASTFTFTPPPGAKVVEHTAGHQTARDHSAKPDHKAGPGVEHHGTGWVQVAVADMGSSTPTGSAAQVLNSLPVVHGSWGTGHLLDGTLFSAVITSDGRLAAGAVTPDLLYAALS